VIYGIGTDIVQVDRIKRLLDQYGERFARRVLGPDELLEFQRRSAKAEHGSMYGCRYLAKRFAAKEAYSKALGLGIRAPMTLQSLEVINAPGGKPFARPRNDLAAYVAERKLTSHVSLSDEIDSVIAFVVIEISQ
jgi:holo-[acyl-carrier protein] synthase